MPALPTLGRTYLVVPKCAPDMSLGGIETAMIEPNGLISYVWTAVLQPQSARRPIQRWKYFAYHDEGARTGKQIAFASDHVNTHYGLMQFQLSYFNDHNMELDLLDARVSTQLANWNLIPVGDFFCLQSYVENSQNINVAGDGPYPENTKILVYDWSGGAPNELWTFVEFD